MSDNLPEAVREYRRRRNRAMVNGEPIASQARADAAIDALIEERERLEVCGTCKRLTPPHMSVSTRDEECPGGGRHSVCIFTPSRYVPYWKEGE